MSASPTPPSGVAVVTGASRGVGRAVALRLAAEGMKVVAVARRADALAELAAEDARIRTVTGDVAVEADVDAVAAAAAAAGVVRAWVNNAAVLEPRRIIDLEAADWDRTLAVNLRGAFLGCRAALRLMRHGGTIVNLGSLSGVAFVEKFPGLAAYNASKAGLAALSEAVALEGRELGVRSVTLAPGAVDTEMLRRAAPGLRPGATPEDVAGLVAFLVSDAAATLSGSTLPLFTNR